MRVPKIIPKSKVSSFHLPGGTLKLEDLVLVFNSNMIVVVAKRKIDEEWIAVNLICNANGRPLDDWIQ